MGNSFTNVRFDARMDVKISNSGTDVFIITLVLAASDVAQTRWQRDLAAWLASRDQTIHGRGLVGFDLSEIAWSTNTFQEDHEFLLAVVDQAISRHRWDDLNLDPQWTADYLRDFRTLVVQFRADFAVPGRNWDPAPPDPPVMCTKHLVYQHRHGCVICHNWTNPEPFVVGC
jgi:hypothetical protein